MLGKDFFDDTKHSVSRCLTPSPSTAPRKTWFSLSASARSRYYLKNLYLTFKQNFTVVLALKTIAKLGEASVVAKVNTTVKAFTLAEVLIVLGIIGLIADMTIPTLHQSITEKVTATQLIKTYSTFENALRMAVAENGPPNEWGMSPSEANDGKQNIFLEKMSKYLRFTKFCGSEKGCYPDYVSKTLDGRNEANINKTPNWSKALLADGSAIALWVSNASCPDSFCGEFIVDLNGKKPPNQSGKDIFWFFFYTDKVLPQGISQTGSGLNDCSLSESGDYNGRRCTAWVIYNGNMDYLHCNDLKWGIKTTCK